MADAAGAKEQPCDKPSEVSTARVECGVRKCFGIYSCVKTRERGDVDRETENNIDTAAGLRRNERPGKEMQALVTGSHL